MTEHYTSRQQRQHSCRGRRENKRLVPNQKLYNKRLLKRKSKAVRKLRMQSSDARDGLGEHVEFVGDFHDTLVMYTLMDDGTSVRMGHYPMIKAVQESKLLHYRDSSKDYSYSGGGWPCLFEGRQQLFDHLEPCSFKPGPSGGQWYM
jgi:hypothetical protein|tara:strand:- start:503 stop:943 length:441 start_codon:yes stop_codon:yes gene_type:complete